MYNALICSIILLRRIHALRSSHCPLWLLNDVASSVPHVVVCSLYNVLHRRIPDHHHHHHERAPGWSVAVSTSCLHRSLSWASRHAELSPWLSGWRSALKVRSQVWRGRPGRRLQSLGSPRVDVCRAVKVSWESLIKTKPPHLVNCNLAKYWPILKRKVVHFFSSSDLQWSEHYITHHISNMSLHSKLQSWYECAS